MIYQRNWTNDEAQKAQAYYDKRLPDGVSEAQIYRELAEILNRSSNAIGHRFKRRGRGFIGKYREPPRSRPSRASTNNHVAKAMSIPEEVIAERNRVALLGYRTTTARLMGDPLPGRSALDRLKSE